MAHNEKCTLLKERINLFQINQQLKTLFRTKNTSILSDTDKKIEEEKKEKHVISGLTSKVICHYYWVKCWRVREEIGSMYGERV